MIGVLLLLFGISWVGFAAVQPIPAYMACHNGFPAPNGIPSCGFPSQIAVAYYILGFVGIAIGVVLLASRLRRKG